MRSSAFLAVDAHSDITFTSTSVELIGNDCYRVARDLIMKGVRWNPIREMGGLVIQQHRPPFNAAWICRTPCRVGRPEQSTRPATG